MGRRGPLNIARGVRGSTGGSARRAVLRRLSGNAPSVPCPRARSPQERRARPPDPRPPT